MNHSQPGCNFCHRNFLPEICFLTLSPSAMFAAMEQNPYASPQSFEPPAAVEANQAVGYRLFSPQQIGVATFLGAPVAGAFFLSQNYRQLGNTGAGTQSLVWGLLGTILLMIVSFFLPENFPNSVIPIGCTFGMLYAAKHLQGPAVEQHTVRGGRLGSWWTVVGVGLLSFAIICAIVFTVVFMTLADSSV
jgi:peptidoglycan/LPS O-acetylase OafA/YrhL